MIINAIEPKEGNWTHIYDPGPKDDLILSWKRYESPLGIRIISAVEMVEGKPQYHISISYNGERIPASIVLIILKQFGADGWEEDNHMPFGKARNFWKPITSDVPEVCPCKENEKPIIEDDYIWREK